LKHLIRVEVTWNDAHGNALGEFAQHEIPHAPYVWTTIGYLLREDDNGISLAAEVGETNNFRGVSFIPKAMILKVKRPKLRSSLSTKHPQAPHQDGGPQ
jgi:hypothetical protein